MNVGKIMRFTGDVAQARLLRRRHEGGGPRAAPGMDSRRRRRIGEGAAVDEEHRHEVARLLSSEGEGYLPQPLAAIERTLTFYDHEHYGPSGAIQHPEWGNSRIDFIPYPYPSYTEALVRFLQTTYVEGERAFLKRLDPAAAHRQLVDDAFVRKALGDVGGLRAFGLPNRWTRDEVVAI